LNRDDIKAYKIGDPNPHGLLLGVVNSKYEPVRAVYRKY